LLNNQKMAQANSRYLVSTEIIQPRVGLRALFGAQTKRSVVSTMLQVAHFLGPGRAVFAVREVAAKHGRLSKRLQRLGIAGPFNQFL